MGAATKLIKGTKKLSKFDMLSIGVTGYFGYQTYKDNRAQGNNIVTSTLAAGGEMVKNELLGLPGMLALGAIKGIPNLAVKGTMGLQKLSRQSARQRFGNSTPFYNATFTDTQQAYTMRQAGMQLAENSKYNLQQSLMGNEAAMLHM